MKRLGIIANCDKPGAQQTLEKLAKQAGQLGISLVAFGQTARALPDAVTVDADQFDKSIDLLMALGGDGTMLRAVRSLGDDAAVPVIGVNLGSLGFMTSITEEKLEEALNALNSGNYTTSKRSLLSCELIREGATLSKYAALNDIVLGWSSSTRVTSLGLSIDGEKVTSYLCDGLIVSTPTGSTGHSLSAAGPILHPETEAILINVICPHTLSARPLVISDRSSLEIIAQEIDEGGRLRLSVDGQTQEDITVSDRLSIRKHPNPVELIHLPGYSYFSVLRHKLHWRGRNV